MSRLQLKRFAFSRAKFKGNDDADARWTADGFFFPLFFAGGVPCVIQLIVVSIRTVALVMVQAAAPAAHSPPPLTRQQQLSSRPCSGHAAVENRSLQFVIVPNY